MLLACHRERVEHQELLNGILASTVANFSFCHPKTPLKAIDFMLSKKAKKKAERDLVADGVRAFFTRAMAKQAAEQAKTGKPIEE